MSRAAKILVMVIAAALALCGCGLLRGHNASPQPTEIPAEMTPAPTPGPPIQNGTLRVGAPLPNTLHPLQVRLPEWISLYQLLFPRLYRLDEGLDVFPELVDQASQPDGLHWSISLSTRYRWQDGTPVTAHDVAATLAWLLPSASGGYPMDSPWSISPGLIQSYSVPEDDPYRLDITLYHEAGYLPWLLTFPILPAHIYGSAVPDMSTIPLAAPFLVGCDSYRVSAGACTDSVLVCERTARGGGKPSITRIEMTAIPSYGAGLSAVERGALDLVNIPPNNYVADMEYAAAIYPYYTGEYQFLAFSPADRLPEERAILEAATYALDRKQIINAVYFGNAALVDSPIRPDTWFYDPEYQWYEYNPDKADEILTRAGWVDIDGDKYRERKEAQAAATEQPTETPSAEETEAAAGTPAPTPDLTLDDCTIRLLVVESNDLSRQAAKLIRDQLYKIGIRVDVAVLPWESHTNEHEGYLDQVRMCQYDMAFAGAYVQSLPIPGELFVYWPQAASIPTGARWESWGGKAAPPGRFPYANEAIRQRLDAVALAQDRDEIQKVYRGMDTDGVWQSLSYSLFYRLGHLAASPKLMGVTSARQTDLFMGIDEWYLTQ